MIIICLVFPPDLLSSLSRPLIPYPTKEVAWSGYGVVQAKFKQRSQDSQKDGEWAIQQLRDELEKFVAPERKLRRPDYYIFATNVVLTPVQASGSKDKVDALIKKYKRRLGLKGYDIWDYDKIRAFLDAHESIRRAYAAWITPGDVLVQAIEWLKPQQADFAQTITNFLQKELLADQYAKLEQAGHTADDRIPLASVFVDLPVANERSNEPPKEENGAKPLPPGFVAEALQAASERLDPQSLEVAIRPGIKWSSMITCEPGRFVLIGGPGQGKTTVGQFICQLFRAAILREKPAPSLSREAQQALKQIEAQCQHEGMLLPTARRFPIRIVLSDFATMLASSDAPHINSLLSYIVDRIRKRTDRQISADDFRSWLGLYPWVLILDGLDEVPASSNRDQVLATINDFWIDAAGSNADVMVIATTRPQGYNQDFAPDVYQHKWLMPLSTARALHYADRLADIRFPNDSDRKSKVLQRLQRAANTPATLRLMHSPLQVTIMTTLVDQMGQPPQERWSLFKEYYNVIYKRELERDIPAAVILRDHKADIDMIHSHVGLQLQVESERSGRTDARLLTARFAEIVEARLRAEGYAGNELEALSNKIIDAATTRLVFLVGVEANEVGFEIRSLQEFMAAEGLMDGNDNEVQDRLREIAPIISWRNVFLFAAGKCFAERQYLRNTVQAICVQLNDDPDDRVAQAALAGSQLALELLEDGPARRQPNFARSLARLALRLLDLPPADYHLRLADLYEINLEPVYREELERRLVGGNAEQTFGAWACLIPLIEASISWAEELGNSRWSTGSNSQANLLFWLFEREKGKEWSLNQLIDVFPHCSPSELSDDQEILNRIKRIAIPKPDWFCAALAVLGKYSLNWYTEFPLCLQNIDKGTFRFSIIPLRGQRNVELIPLKNMPNNNEDWTILIAGARLQETPSKSILAREIRAIMNSSGNASTNRLSYKMPWPLLACVLTLEINDQLSNLADKVEAGDFGDVEDWLLAEERWKNNGVVLDDLNYMSDEHWPFDKHIAHQGFPFARCGTSIRDTPERTVLLRNLLEVYEQHEGKKLKSTIANWSVFLLSTMNDVHTHLLELFQPQQIRGLILDTLEIRWQNSDQIAAMMPDSEIDEESIQFLNNIGMHPQLRLWQSNEALATLVAEIFSAQPTYRGVLRLLSKLILNGAHPNLAHITINPATFSEPIFREAALIVRVAQGFEQPDEAKRLAQYTVELMQTQPEVVVEMLNVTSEQRAATPHNDRFLLELLEQTPHREWKIITQLEAELNDSLRRRTSRLNQPLVWSRIGLPVGLNRV